MRALNSILVLRSIRKDGFRKYKRQMEPIKARFNQLSINLFRKLSFLIVRKKISIIRLRAMSML